MNGPVVSGGVIVLVAALLWMTYLVPSWRGRHQFNAAERNAVRLNRALRTLAETSEMPEEVRVELRAKSILAQQRLAKRVLSEKEAAELAHLRAELAAVQQDPVARQARARRRVRMAATLSLAAGLISAGAGVWLMLGGGSALLLISGTVFTVVAAGVLQKMSLVARRAARRQALPTASRVSRPATVLEDHSLTEAKVPQWTPRALPTPLVSTPGSRAQMSQGVAAEQAVLRERERLAALRQREVVIAPAAPTKYARMGYVNDAEIEAHVRELLAKRSA